MLQAAFVFALIGIAFFGSYQASKPPAEAIPMPAQNGSTYVVKEKESLLEKALDPVALVTLLLVFVTWRMATSINEQVRLAREEFNATHRPEIVTREVTWEMVDMDGGEVLDDNAITFALVNRGRNACTIVESVFGLRTNAPDSRALPTGGANLLGRVTLAAGQFDHFRYEIASEVESFAVGSRSLSDCYFRGTIIYEDRARARRRYAFTRICRRGTDRFTATDTQEDEYND
jgi:hypothetical protein